MNIYDGSIDKKIFPTNRTVAVVSCNRIVEKMDFMTFRKNGREDWSLFFCEAGRLYFDGTAINQGEIWIYPPHVAQKYVSYKNDNTIYRYLHFTGSDIENLLGSLGIKTLAPIAAHDPLILKALDSIRADADSDDPLSCLRAEYHTLHLFSRLAGSGNQTSKSGAIKRVVDDMEHSFLKEYDAAYYAELMGLSVSRFNHLFKEQTGQSPYAFFINIRIDNATALLEQTDLKIKDIATKCGFDDPLYFTQVFKKLRGVSPSEYRKSEQI